MLERLERLVLKNPPQRTSQRVKWTSGVVTFVQRLLTKCRSPRSISSFLETFGLITQCYLLNSSCSKCIIVRSDAFILVFLVVGLGRRVDGHKAS